MSGNIFALLFSIVSKCVLVLLCLLAHELAHVLVARHYHVPVKKIGFNWMGMYIQRSRTRGWPEVFVCMAGAAMNLALAAAFWNVNSWFALCNLVVGLVNILPVANSDGSHALEALHEMRGGVAHRSAAMRRIEARDSAAGD